MMWTKCKTSAILLLLAAGCLQVAAKDGKSGKENPDSPREAEISSETGSGSLKTDLESRFRLGFDWEWKDVGNTDWAVAHGGPDITADTESALLFKLPFIGALKTGPVLDFTLGVETASRATGSGTPYLVVSSLDGLFSGGLRTEAELMPEYADVSAVLDLLGNVDCAQYTDSDKDYLPSDADPEEFWARILVGGGVGLSVKAAAGSRYGVEADGEYAAWWDAEETYELSRLSGYRASAHGGIWAGFGSKRSVYARVSANGGASWDTGFVAAERKLDFALSAAIDIDRKLLLELRPAVYREKITAPDFSGTGIVERTQRLCSSLVWESDLPGGRFSVRTDIPWWFLSASFDGEELEEIWKLSCSWEMKP